MNKIARLRHGLLLCLAAIASIVTDAALAKDVAKQPPSGALPGVDSGYAIVKPMPEPDDALPAGDGKQFRIGNTDVRISGRIILDVGAGNIRPPRH